jgi:hypothetical protein
MLAFLGLSLIDWVPGAVVVSVMENVLGSGSAVAEWQQTFPTTLLQGAFVAVQLLLVAGVWWKGFVRRGGGRLCAGYESLGNSGGDQGGDGR